jgi:hypothetical protein
LPLLAAVTCAITVHTELLIPAGAAGNDAPDTLSEFAVKVALPPIQLVDAGPVTTTPAGIVSVNENPFIGVALKLRRVMVSVEIPPA